MDQTLKYNIVGDASSLIRASETAKQAGASLTSQLSSGFNETTVTIQRSVAAVTAMQARINDMVGIGSRGTKEWTGALAQQGQLLDQLRAKYNPLYAAQQTYLANLNDIKAAHAIGALSADEMSAAIVREKAAFATTIVNMNKVGGAAKLTSNQLLNLSRQGNDVATMFALGAPPMQIFASQAGQIYDALEQGPGGIKGSLKAIGEGLLGLIMKFPIATAAIVAAGAAFIVYESIGGKKIASIDEALTEHAKTIKALREAYGIAGDGADDYARRSVAALESAQRRAEAALRESVAAAEKQAKSAISDSGGFSGFGLLQQLGLVGTGDLNAVKTRFAAFAEPINTLRDQIRAGKPDFDAFQQALDSIASTNPGRLRPLADEILALVDNAANGREALDNMSVALNGLTQSQIDTARIVSQINGIEQAAQAAQGAVGALKTMLGNMDQIAAGIDPTGNAIGGKGSLDRAQANFNDALEMWRRFGYDNDSKVDPNKPKKAKVDHSAERAANAYRDVLKSAQDRIDQMKVELDLTGQVGVAADTLRNYQELLSRATDHGRSIGEKQKAELKDRAEQLAVLAQRTAEAKLQQDLLFDRSQLGRSDIDQQIAEMQRSAGLSVDLGSASASMFRMNEQIRTTQDAWKGFGDAAEDALGKLIDGTGTWKDALKAMIPALQDLIMQLLKAQSIGMGGSGDFSLGGLLSSVFGGGGNAFPSAPSGGGGSIGGLWAKGGAFSRGNVIPFARGGVVSQPTMFSMSGGRSGIMGEAGEEGILPLRRTSSGHLGVMASGAANNNQPSPINVTFAPTLQGGDSGSNEDSMKQLRTMFDREFLPRTVKAIREAKTRGMLS